MDGWFDDERISWADCAIVAVFLLSPVILLVLGVYALQTVGVVWIGQMAPLDLTRGAMMVGVVAVLGVAAMLVLGILSMWSALRDHQERLRRLSGSGL